MRILKGLWRENVVRKINCCGCAVLPSLKSSLFKYKILTEKILGTVFSWMYLVRMNSREKCNCSNYQYQGLFLKYQNILSPGCISDKLYITVLNCNCYHGSSLSSHLSCLFSQAGIQAQIFCGTPRDPREGLWMIKFLVFNKRWLAG